MQNTKRLSLIAICLLMAVVILPGIDAQTRSSLVPEASLITPYTEVRRDNLLNGMQIVTLEREGDRRVRCDIVIRTGSMYDLTGKTGLAVLTQESLMAANPQVKEELESLQSSIDWGVNWDTTWFHLEIQPSNFENVLEILARLLVVEDVRDDAFKVTHKRHLENVKSLKPTDAQSADMVFYNAVYGTHPYGHNLPGTEATVNNINQGDVYDFIRRFYIANNVSAIISGNITNERVLRTFKVFFGGWIKGEVIPPTFRPPRQVKQLNLVRIEKPESTHTEIRAGLVGFRYADPEFSVTEIIARILTSRLRNSPQGAGREFVITPEPRILPGPFLISASIPAESAPDFSQHLTDSFASLARTLVTDEELKSAKSALSAEYSARPMEDNLRDIEVYSLPRNRPLTIGSRIEEITADEVRQVAKKMFDANALTVVVMGKIGESFNNSRK